ncbi:ATP-binding cassette sub-family F member 3 [Nosema bombycis CQ1]|uniref:ATP-binding cassette sub-family F member 3 n=1 Tax=Nosema bombycis (strain CQ1 / CVCC 102059) TaxID=578461 RepID=R0KTI6_NOSB1|nr:ATP-binding cassette sub-family F member 3 [Nosema bombycis CQ1]|eukprot:EOB14131.1 ATP-binding cassette sub-family F member 3 [Nosema bombycis CQ1]
MKNNMHKFFKTLENFPFESEDDIKSIQDLKIKYNVNEDFLYKVDYEDTIIPLETPVVIKPKIKREVKSLEQSKEEIEFYSSSSEESNESSDSDSLYYDDIQMDINLSIKGKPIVVDQPFTIERGKKYGLVGRNGIGKTTLLKAIKRRKFGIPKGIKIYMIEQECDLKIKVIDHVGKEGGRVLCGFGFTKEMFDYPLSSLSGGWRMRSHLAKAINTNPDLLLLDEPTNYLDINALTWLESQIKLMKTVIVVSHDKNFLNTVVDEIIHLNDYKLDLYKGNYNAFVSLRNSRLILQQREYENQLAQREHLQSFIDRFRYNSSRAALAQSKIKILNKMPPLNPPKKDPNVKFKLFCNSNNPIIEFRDVSFSYPNKLIFKNLTISINKNSRIVIVGANGQGKSTFLKILNNDLKNCDGFVNRSNVNIGYFAQHHVDNININEKVLDLLLKENSLEESKKALASFGLNLENQRIGTLSGGQKSKLTLALLNLKKPNLLIFDEPTNHLDLESIEALAEAINKYEGGVVCVSHDLNFVTKAFKEVYVCENNTLKYFNGSVLDYKERLLK